MKRNSIIILSILLGFPLAILINIFTEYLFIVDNGYCYEYRFQKLSWFLDFFYDGYHHDTNLINFLFTLLLGVYLAYLIISSIIKFKNR